MDPFFSIVIPAYNRGPQLARALRSVQAQRFSDYEVIVVDDCSTDDTVATAQKFEDPRFRVVKREKNGGPCQARNSGIDVARGRWLVMLDSDFTFRDPDALSRLADRCARMPKDIGNCISACEWDNGWLTPQPMPPMEMDYSAYLRWLNGATISEYFNCIRREVFSEVRYARSRAWEMSFHLALAKKWRLSFHSAPLVTVHTDAANRLTTSRGRNAYLQLLLDAPDKHANFLEILSEHGTALRTEALTLHGSICREAMKQALLSGNRIQAWKHWTSGWMATSTLKYYLILFLGIIHPRLLAYFNSIAR